METEPSDIREVRHRVGKNSRLLQELMSGPKRKGELANALDVTKQTVYNRFKDLDEYDLVERQEGRYRLTTVGRIIVERHLQSLEAMEDLFEARRLLQSIPVDTLPPQDGIEAVIPVVPNEHPEQVRREFCEWVLGADEVRGLFPHTSCAFVERVREKLRTNGLSIELAVSPETLAYLREYRAEALRAVLESDSAFVVEAVDLPSFGLVVVDAPQREAGLIVYTDDGYVRGFMRFPTESAHQWADEQLAGYTDEQRTQTTSEAVNVD